MPSNCQVFGTWRRDVSQPVAVSEEMSNGTGYFDFYNETSMIAGLALSASPLTLAGANNAYAEAKQTTPEKSLYERLGGEFAIAAVVDHFSDAVVKSPDRRPEI